MRIAFFTDTYIPNTDGVVTALLAYRKELESLGHEVFIFSPGTRKQKEENPDAHVHYFTSASFKPYPDYRIALYNFLSPVKVVKDLNLDIIHSHGIATTGLLAIQCAKKLNVPAVASFHTMVPHAMAYITSNQSIQNILESAAWKYLHWYYSQFDKVLVPSEYVKKILEQHNITNVVLHPSGIDINKFSSAKQKGKFRKTYGIDRNKDIVLFVGRIAREKNIDMIIESAPSVLNVLPETKFAIVGKGPEDKYYQDIIKKKGLEQHIIMAGRIDDELLLDAYVESSMFAFPSEFDTQGLAVIEALAAGLPSVVKKGTAAAEIVQDDFNGYIFSDKFDLHEKIINSIKNRKKLSANAKESVKKYEISELTKRLLELYGALKEKKKQK